MGGVMWKGGLLLAVAGCEVLKEKHEDIGLAYEDAEVTVDLSGAVPRFDWEDGAAHELRVAPCNGTCSCDDGDGRWDGESTPVWLVSGDPFQSLEQRASEDPFVAPPVAYGEAFPEAGWIVGPLELAAGTEYLVVVERLAEPIDGNTTSELRGCALFTP